MSLGFSGSLKTRLAPPLASLSANLFETISRIRSRRLPWSPLGNQAQESDTFWGFLLRSSLKPEKSPR